MLGIVSAGLIHRDNASNGTIYFFDKGGSKKLSGPPVYLWRTSLRKINPDGSDITNVQEYGPPVQTPNEPLGARSFSYDPVGKQFYFASSRNVFRIEFDGTSLTNLVTDTEYLQSVVVHKQKVWYSTFHSGLIKRMNLDGSDVETFLNVSQGLNPIQWASSSARGIAIDDTNNFIYWSSDGGADFALPHRGSIRRAPLQANTTAIEVLAQDIIYPLQMRLSQSGALYWGEANYTTAALRRAYFAPDRVLQPGDTEIETLFSNKTHPELLPYPLTGFALSSNEEKAWITAVDDFTNSGRIIEASLSGGESRIVINNTTLTGLPIGVEYII
ncbi:unnamed protein product [Periconia digitata]|uniref:Uncharacterized protein n=1 Tax=Periconia digitata TaxID=1303443 RepID=A0A9W4XP29_9PLEO|nr:unnamed protein product [Periconia digitata]